MINIDKAFNYACDKYYCVIYDINHCGHEQKVEGLLLNYASGNIVMLSNDGIYHIRYKDIVFMKPTKPRIDKLSEEFKSLLKSFNGEQTK